MEGRGKVRKLKGKRREKTFGGIVVDGNTARGDLGALLCVWDIAEDDIAGHAISDLECCHLYFPVFSLLCNVVRIN